GGGCARGRGSRPSMSRRRLATRVAQDHRPCADGGLHAGSGAIGGFLRSQWLPCWPTTVARARNNKTARARARGGLPGLTLTQTLSCAARLHLVVPDFIVERW